MKDTVGIWGAKVTCTSHLVAGDNVISVRIVRVRTTPENQTLIISLSFLFLLVSPSLLDDQVPQPPLQWGRRKSMLHGGQLPASTVFEGPSGPRILQISLLYLHSFLVYVII